MKSFVFPAGAGMILGYEDSWSVKRRVPRGSGDDPSIHEPLLMDSECSPRERG